MLPLTHRTSINFEGGQPTICLLIFSVFLSHYFQISNQLLWTSGSPGKAEQQNLLQTGSRFTLLVAPILLVIP